MRSLLWFGLFLVVACGDSVDNTPTASLPQVTVPAAFDSVLRAYERAYAAHDARAMAQLFAEDGYLMERGAPSVRGRAAIEAGLRGEGGPIVLVPVAHAISDSAGYVIGTFGAERSAGEGGKFVLALKRTGGGPWLIAADIANPNF